MRNETNWLRRAWAWAHEETVVAAVFLAGLFTYVGIDRGAQSGILVALSFYAMGTIVANGLLIYPLLHALLTLRPSALVRRARQMSRLLWIYLVVSTSFLMALLLAVLPTGVLAPVLGGSVPILLMFYALDLLGLLSLRGD